MICVVHLYDGANQKSQTQCIQKKHQQDKKNAKYERETYSRYDCVCFLLIFQFNFQSYTRNKKKKKKIITLTVQCFIVFICMHRYQELNSPIFPLFVCLLNIFKLLFIENTKFNMEDFFNILS